MWTKFYKRSLTFWSQVGVPLCLNKIHPSSCNTDEWGTLGGRKGNPCKRREAWMFKEMETRYIETVLSYWLANDNSSFTVLVVLEAWSVGSKDDYLLGL